jgi:hypothetical protein
MKSIRLKYCTAQGCTFKFVNRANVKNLEVRQEGEHLHLLLSLMTGEEIEFLGAADSLEGFNQRWSRFESSDEIFFDLSEFEVKR